LSSLENKDNETGCCEYITEAERGTNCTHLFSGKGYFGHIPRLNKEKKKGGRGRVKTKSQGLTDLS